MGIDLVLHGIPFSSVPYIDVAEILQEDTFTFTAYFWHLCQSSVFVLLFVVLTLLSCLASCSRWISVRRQKYYGFSVPNDLPLCDFITRILDSWSLVSRCPEIGLPPRPGVSSSCHLIVKKRGCVYA